MMQGLLTLDDVNTAYIGSDFSIERICLSLDYGDVLTLYGREGSGKTLILRTIAGLEACSGNILLDGKKLSDIQFKDRDIGYTFDFSSLGKDKSVGEILEYPMRLRNYDDNRIADIIKSVEEKYSLCKEDKVESLSEFEKVKLILARLFCIQRRLYLVDDIWKDLQDQERSVIADILQVAIEGKSVIIATQDVELARRLGKNNISVVANGECSKNCSLEEMTSRPINIESAILCGYAIYMDVLGKNEQGYFANIDGKVYQVDRPLNDIYVGKQVCFAYDGKVRFYYDKDCEKIIS
ncbi:MAG: ATP-binding cassette domain-containing protein [Clostridia bacterium]|nr:ATP-binding cassette domain-containing protein [Clostridia bacterium]